MSDPDYKPQAWRMAGYYPGQYAKSMAALGIGIDYSDDDHDRYEAQFLADLAEHDAAVKREAAAVALEEFAAELRERYPEDVFRPLADKDHRSVNDALAGRVERTHVTRDAVSADMMRRAASQAIEFAGDYRDGTRTPGEETTP